MEEFFRRHRPAGQREMRFTAEHAENAEKNFRITSANSAVSAVNNAYAETSRRYLQIHDCFIIAENDDGFAIIDQHALHERIMYEHLKRRVHNSPLESQKLLVPESFQLTKEQSDTLENNSQLFEKLGIEVAPFGPKIIAIQAFPVLLAKAEPADFVLDVLDMLTEKATTLDAESLFDEVLHMAACKAAIKAGQKLTDSEIEQLIADKETVEQSSSCPHGRPTVIKFTVAELEKQFKRT